MSDIWDAELDKIIVKERRAAQIEVLEKLKYKSAIYQHQWKMNDRLQAEINRLREVKE